MVSRLSYLLLFAPVCRNDSYQELDQDYSGTKRTSALQQLHLPSSCNKLPVNASGPSGTLVPTNDPNLQVRQSVKQSVDTEPAKLCHEIETTFKELCPTPMSATPPSITTAFPQIISEPTLVSPQPLSVHASVLPKLRISTTSTLASTTHSLTTPPLKVQTLRPPLVSLSSSFVTVPASLSSSISASSQMSQGSKESSPARSTSPVTTSHSQSLASPSKTSAVRHISLPPIVENQGSRGLQVTQSTLPQSTHLPVLPRPSFSLAPAQRSLSPPKFSSPQTNFLTDTAVDNILCAFPTSIAVASTFPFTEKLLSTQQFSELPLVVTDTNVILPSCQGTGHVASHKSEQPSTVISCSPININSVSEVSLTHHKVSTSSMCKQEGHIDITNEAVDKIPESSLSIPYTKEPEKDFSPVAKKDISTSEGQATSGKGNDDTLNDVWDTETKNCMTLPERIYVNRPEAMDCCEHPQNEGSFMFEDGSINKVLGDMLPENDLTDDTSCEKNAMDLSTQNYSNIIPLKDNSQIHNYLDDTPLVDASQHFSSLNDFPEKFNKGKAM